VRSRQQRPELLARLGVTASIADDDDENRDGIDAALGAASSANI
jgi:hypothetical protein